MSKPGSDPLGAKPVLPPPTGNAADRASKAFKEYIDTARRTTARQTPAPPAPGPGLPQPDSFASGRRYDIALSMVQSAQSGETAAQDPDAPASADTCAGVGLSPQPGTPDAAAQAMPDADTHVTPAPDADRPPPGAPTVRPPVKRATPEAVPQDLLETAADSAMLSANPDGSTSFDVAFNDDLFSDLACRITVLDGRIVATFRVTDDNTRRLLEAESRALVARLEERGLRVQEVRVEKGTLPPS